MAIPVSGLCRACGAGGSKPLHTQHFVLPGAPEKLAYEVVTCPQCGFVFADGIPSPDVLDAHYGAAEHHLHSSVPEGLRAIHVDFFQFIQDCLHLPPSARVLDIGSGMGHFLNLFRTAGHKELVGLEPSRAARELARAAYEIEVVTESVTRYQPENPFDLVTMCGVLKHIADLNRALAKLHELTTPGGHLFVAVPDATRFGESPAAEPFLEFALEHINFFTPRSLSNLLERCGFEPVRVESRHNDFYDNHYLYALFRAGAPGARAVRYDPEGAACVTRYVEDSNHRLLGIRTAIESLAARGKPVVLWGAGSLATRLCATTSLDRLQISAFIDKNRQLHGKTVLGVSIHAPEWLDQADHNLPVVILSAIYGAEIERMLVERFDWKGEILRVDRMSVAS